MNIAELKDKLDSEHISPSYYDLNSGTREYGWGDVYALTKEVDGWAVFFAERGIERERKIFATESEACSYFYDWIRQDKTIRIGYTP